MSFQLTIQDMPHYTYKDYELWQGDSNLNGKEIEYFVLIDNQHKQAYNLQDYTLSPCNVKINLLGLFHQNNNFINST